MTVRRAWPALLVSLLLAACAEEEAPLVDPVDVAVEFGAGEVQLISADGIDTVTIGVEVAETERQTARGLMQRSSLAPDSGMIFLFRAPQPSEKSFWMYNTLIPLAIAYIGEDGRIGSIRQMEPCTSPYPQFCPQYASGVPFIWALEVNPGFFEEHGLGIGDQVVLQRR